ncbi:MAG: SDR family oxidoreductase [Candidatus Zixiibacteriota bacterium]|nr:MAG: SDR family oxidoreductase [candidate division Zixibacteria bacterium]
MHSEGSQNMSLEGKVALVTGASRGIGAATAKLLAGHGAAVGVNYARSEQAAKAVVDGIVSAGGKAIMVQADVRARDMVASMVKTIGDRLGPIDILVLNAGAKVPLKFFMDMSYGEFENKVMGELAGFFHPLQEVIPGMIQRGKGCIIGISSGLSRYPGLKFSAHTTAKSGVDGLMKSLALELGPHGIRVNTVAPGLTITDATSWMPKEQMDAVGKATPLGRVALPEDVAGVVLALVSEAAGFVSGAYVPVSGGQQMT